MADTDIERLIVSLEARTAAFERQLAKANGVTNQRMRAIDQRIGKTNANLARFGSNAFAGLARGAIGAVVPILSLAAAVRGTTEALSAFGAISDNSKAAGLDSEFFQGVAYQAGLAGVSVEQLAGALANFNRSSGQSEEETGRMYAALQKLNPELLAAIKNATTQEERVRLAAQAMADAGSSAQKAALGVALFGEAGSKLVDAFSGGAASLDETREKARALGIVVDRDLIARADELGDEFDTVTQIIDVQLKQALVGLSPILIGVGGLIGDWIGSLNIVLDQFNDIESRRFLRPLQNELAATYNEMQPIRDRIAEIQEQLSSGGPNGMVLRLDLGDAQNQLSDLTAQADALLSRITELQGRPGPAAVQAPPQASGQTGPTPEEMALTRQLFLYTNPDYTDRSQLPPATSPASSGGARNDSAAAAIKQAEAVKAMIAELQFENSLIGLSAIELARLTALRQAGAAATEEQRAEIARLVEANIVEQQQIDALQQGYEELGRLGRAAIDGIVDAMADGKIEGQELLGIVTDLLSQAGSFFLDQAFSGFGGGTGGNFLSSLFGGGRAKGGPVKAGMVYKVNENTPNSEYFSPGVDGMIIPSLPKARGDGGASLTVAPVINFGGGADAMSVEQLRVWSRFELPQIIRHHLKTTIPENG